MLNPLGVLSLQLACQLLVSKNYSSLIDIKDIGTPLIKSAQEIPEGYTVFPDIGVAYKFYKNELSWYAARRYCKKEGGNLAIIDSLKKVEYVKPLIGSETSWVGIHRLFGDDEWTSVKHDSLETTLPWRSDSYRGTSTYQCVRVTGGSDVGLYVNECAPSLNFMCEVSMFKDEELVRYQSLQLN